MYLKPLRRALLALVLGAVAFAASADDGMKFPKHYINVGFINTKLSQPGFPTLRSNYGGSFTWGRTYWVTRPIMGHTRIGIDLAWFDASYTNYRVDMTTFDGYHDLFDIHEIELGIQAGLGAYYSFGRHLGVRAFARYNPCFSGSYRGDDDIKGAFGNFVVAGASFNWYAIGVGIEYRWGKAHYASPLEKLSGMIDDLYEDGDDYEPQAPNHYGQANANGKIPTTLSGFRAFITFSF